MGFVKRSLASGFWLMFLAAFVFSIADILTKYLVSQLSIMQIAFIRFLLGAGKNAGQELSCPLKSVDIGR